MHIAILVYLGVFVTPTYDQMFETNLRPLLDGIRADIEVVLIKINILPRLLYPRQLVTVLLSNKLIEVLIGWLSSCIWSKRNPWL